MTHEALTDWMCAKCKRQVTRNVDLTEGAIRGWYACKCKRGPHFPLRRIRP